jgi:hypothetical protein
MAQSRTKDETEITLAQARSLLERHFGAGKVPEKYMNLLSWWGRLLADAAAPPNSLRACQRDLEEIIGPIARERAGWRMRK